MPRLSALERVRRMALALPETAETHTWGETQFRVRDKIFVFAGRDAVWVKADPEEREALLQSGRGFVPPYVGKRGWVGVQLGPFTDWAEVAELVETSYRLIAPKRLAAQV